MTQFIKLKIADGGGERRVLVRVADIESIVENESGDSCTIHHTGTSVRCLHSFDDIANTLPDVVYP